MIEERIRKDLTNAQLARDACRVEALRLILGEIPRLNKKLNEKATDEEIINIIRKLIKSEKLVLEYSGTNANSSTYIKTLEKYIPKMMSDQEIKQWILDNIDLSAYSNTVQAMGKIMKELKGKADGNIVKRVLIGFN